MIFLKYLERTSEIVQWVKGTFFFTTHMVGKRETTLHIASDLHTHVMACNTY